MYSILTKDIALCKAQPYIRSINRLRCSENAYQSATRGQAAFSCKNAVREKGETAESLTRYGAPGWDRTSNPCLRSFVYAQRSLINQALAQLAIGKTKVNRSIKAAPACPNCNFTVLGSPTWHPFLAELVDRPPMSAAQ